MVKLSFVQSWAGAWPLTHRVVDGMAGTKFAELENMIEADFNVGHQRERIETKEKGNKMALEVIMPKPA